MGVVLVGVMFRCRDRHVRWAEEFLGCATHWTSESASGPAGPGRCPGAAPAVEQREPHRPQSTHLVTVTAAEPE